MLSSLRYHNNTLYGWLTKFGEQVAIANILLKKYDLETHDEETIRDKIEKLDSSDLNKLQKKLNAIEGHFTKPYFNQIFRLLP